MQYAIVENGLVTNVIVADAEFVAEHCPGAVLCEVGGIGWTYADGVFTPPPPPPPAPPPPPSTVMSKWEFRKRLTFAERIVVDNYDTNTALRPDEKAAMRTFMLDFEAAQEINLNDPVLIMGVTMLETMGLLPLGRATEILTP